MRHLHVFCIALQEKLFHISGRTIGACERTNPSNCVTIFVNLPNERMAQVQRFNPSFFQGHQLIWSRKAVAVTVYPYSQLGKLIIFRVYNSITV